MWFLEVPQSWAHTHQMCWLQPTISSIWKFYRQPLVCSFRQPPSMTLWRVIITEKLCTLAECYSGQEWVIRPEVISSGLPVCRRFFWCHTCVLLYTFGCIPFAFLLFHELRHTEKLVECNVLPSSNNSWLSATCSLLKCSLSCNPHNAVREMLPKSGALTMYVSGHMTCTGS